MVNRRKIPVLILAGTLLALLVAVPFATAGAAAGVTERAVAKGNGRRLHQPRMHGTVAIIVDDTAETPDTLSQWQRIHLPLTFAVLPYRASTRFLAVALHKDGDAILLHIPTEDTQPFRPPQGHLRRGMTRGAVGRLLDSQLAQVPYAEGINNHRGRIGTKDLRLMMLECQWAKKKGLYVVDSGDRGSTVAEAAMSLGMEKRRNEVFLDVKTSRAWIRSKMLELASIANQDGVAIGICHYPRRFTPGEVGLMMEHLHSEGIDFAFVRDVHEN